MLEKRLHDHRQQRVLLDEHEGDCGRGEELQRDVHDRVLWFVVVLQKIFNKSRIVVHKACACCVREKNQIKKKKLAEEFSLPSSFLYSMPSSRSE